MFKLVKYLKKSTGAIIVIIGLLALQAVCDLSLPDYTSNIVNVGIQQGGIENAVPKAIRKSQLEKLTLFVNDEDKKEVLDKYNLIDKSKLTEEEVKKYEKAYPNIKEEVFYELNTKNEEDIQRLNKILGKPELIVVGFEDEGEQGKLIREQILGNMPPQMKAQGQEDIFKIFTMMPKEQLTKINEGIDETFKDMPESIITQSAVKYVEKEYKAIGVDTDKLQSKYILIAGGKMLLIALISMIATVAVGYLGARVAAALGRDLRSGVFRKVISFSNVEFDKFSTASLITRSTNDIQQIQMLMVMLLRIVFYAPILGIGGVIKVINTDTSMAWIIGIAVLSILTLVIVLFSVAMPKFKKVQQLIDRVNLVTREILTGMMVIRAFSTEKHEEKRFDKANKDLTKVNLFVNRTMSIMMPTMMLIMNAITILIVWNGAKSVDAGTMQVGNMMAFIQYTMQIIMAFLMISMVSIMLPRASVSATRIGEVLGTEVEIKDAKNPEKGHEGKTGIVEFNNVSFRYPNAEEDVLRNISFVAKPGETTAIIGSTGSGKSTLINLIPRFYDITSGTIKIDGVDIRKMTQHELRDKIGYVPQKAVLFSGTIDSNLKYAREDAKEEELKKAAEIAQATEFISSMPQGFDTEISQGGTNVSGGQKQRLSIARAIVKNPEIYIFDDSFSALDFKTDATLRKALKAETSNSTVLIVAQRISTILHAEQIIVLDEGEIVGVGNHKTLLENCEVYKQIALSQLSKEELANG